MGDRPIIFSAPMVRALLEGRKTQTRRVLKPQPWRNDVGQWLWERRPGQHIPFHPGLPREHYGTADIPADLPYVCGGRLWVRETWAPGPLDPSVVYRATAEADGWEVGPDARWRPSIHMPRWASRLTLIVTDVRVQRVQEISGTDAFEEGFNYRNRDGDLCHRGDHPSYSLIGFQRAWDDLNAKRGFGWDADPWVVALTFTVHHQNIDQMQQEAS